MTDTLTSRAKDVLGDFEVFENVADDGTLARCRALISWTNGAQGELIRKMRDLRMIQTFSAGVDGLDFASVPRSVQVFSNAGAYAEPVAEHAWGVLLGVAKGVHLRNLEATPRKLKGKTLLVIGAGSIGSEVARLSKSLDMKAIGVSRSFKSPEMFDEKYPISDLPYKISEADAVIIALPLTKTTRGLLSHEILTRSKGTVIMVNVGRGDTVSEEGLLMWLKERPESRFATDVFWEKGGKESFETMAWDHPNFAGTLHVSGSPVGEDLSGAMVAAALNVRRFFETGSALNRVQISDYL